MSSTTSDGVCTFGMWRLLVFVLALASLGGAATAQGTAGTTEGATAPAGAGRTAFDVLKGTWIRPDGGYTIAIRNVDPNGRREAMYFNPNPLPVAKAQGVQDGAT